MPAFVPDLTIILAFALAAFVLAVTPGPDMALQLSRAVNYGRAQGLATAAGAMTGVLVHTSLAAFGISILILTAPTAFLVLKIAGALYLVFLAFQAIAGGSGLRLQARAARPPTLGQSFAAGVAINLLNPKVALFFVTFLPQFVSRDDPAASAKLIFLGLEFVVVSLPVIIAIVLMARWLARVLTETPWVNRALDWSFAAVFTAFAVTILFAEGRR